MEKEYTMKELVELVKEQPEEFVISIDLEVHNES